MTNPDNAVGTNAAYNGRTSINAVNDVLAAFSGRGILNGWTVAPNSGMTVQVGGEGGTRDVAIAEDDDGNRTSVNNISGVPIELTIPNADANNPRIDIIVAYVNNPPVVDPESRSINSPQTCGLIVVSGTPTVSPAVPTDADIRTAITADGASGTTAYYVVLGTIFVSANATAISSPAITQGAPSLPTGSRMTEQYTISTASWSPLSNSSPYTASATVTASASLGNSTVVELLNDQAVLFATYGFAIGQIVGQSITFYTIGTPTDSVTLSVEIY